MKKILLTLVSGNKGKQAEWQRLLPDDFKIELLDLDLDEIQSFDLKEIISDKARRAYQQAQKPVVVEDISAGLDRLNGLPGPFVKFFEKRLGADALFQLSGREGESMTVRCAMAYFDGQEMVIVESEVKGSVVSARGENGFGFDKCFVPHDQIKTYSQMSPAEKDGVSHRARAIAKLLPLLRTKLND